MMSINTPKLMFVQFVFRLGAGEVIKGTHTDTGELRFL